MFIVCFNPPLFSLFYFVFYTYPIFIYFYVKVRYVSGVYSLSSKSSTYFDFFVQELMIITASSLAVSFDFRRFGRRLVLQESFM